MRRVLRADIYDTMEIASLANGGIGQGSVSQGLDLDAPCCALGLGAFASGCDDLMDGYYAGTPLLSALRGAFGLHGEDSDTAVVTINTRKKASLDNRVTFREWCRELNVVRGR